MQTQISTIQTDKAPSAIGPYSQAKVVNGMLYASGQILCGSQRTSQGRSGGSRSDCNLRLMICC